MHPRGVTASTLHSASALCGHLATSDNGAGVNRMRRRGRIVSEAKARGKAARYADGNTIIWRVEASLAVHTL